MDEVAAMDPGERARLRGLAARFEAGKVDDLVEVERCLISLSTPMTIGGEVPGTKEIRAGSVIGARPQEALVSTSTGWLLLRPLAGRPDLLVQDLERIEVRAVAFRRSLFGE
jgi:hypothetical protein